MAMQITGDYFMILTAKHLVFAPLYWKQAKRIKRDTPSLPEAKGDRQGTRLIANAASALPTYQLMIVGDSSAAGGVGVLQQEQALMGQLVQQLANSETLANQFSAIDWQLHATTGHTSFDVLRRLYTLPYSTQPVDMLVIVIGVNDVTKMQSLANWQHNLSEIIKIANHKFSPKNIVFTAIPPMHIFPALPYPFNRFMGDKTTQLDQALNQFCGTHKHTYYAKFAIPAAASQQPSDYFAEDGFHPSALTYQLWAEFLAEFIHELNS